MLKLEVVAGPHRGTRFDRDSGGLTIGRDQGNDIALTRDKRVSRLHAEITPWLDGFRLKDMNSNNGTKVRRGDRLFRLGVIKSDCALETGDRIVLGDSELAVIEAERKVTLIDDDESGRIDMSRSQTEIDDQSFISEGERLAGGPEQIANPAAILNLVAEECLADFDAADVVTIALCKPGSLEIDTAIEGTRTEGAREEHEIAIDRNVYTRTLENGGPHLLAPLPFPTGQDDDNPFLRAGLKSGICLALTVGDETLGFLQIASTTQEDAFTNRHVRAAQIIARRAALTISRLRLIQQVIESRYRQAMEESVEAVVHDLKSPLNIVNCYMQDIRESLPEGDTPSDIRKRFEKADRVIGRMRQLLEDLLHPTGAIPLKFEPVDMNDLLTSVIEDCRSQRGEHMMDIEAEIESGLPTAKIDRAAMRRVFMNMLQNACKAMAVSEEPVCTIQAFRQTLRLRGTNQDCITVRISDRGCGIPESIREKIFDPFVSNMAGTGIGLSVARGIVERHGGVLMLEQTEIDQGSTFAVHIPIER